MVKNQLDIVFFGEDSFSNVILLSLLQAGHHVKLVVVKECDNLNYKRLEGTCIRNSINFYRAPKINDEVTIRKVSDSRPDLCVIAHFSVLIKQELLSIPPMGFINLHPALLPNYRGLSPQHWPIINREKEAGITIHYVDQNADTGNIILQRRFPIDENLYVTDLQKIWLEHYKTCMVEAIAAILAEKPTIKQCHLHGSYYGPLKIEQCNINEKGSVEEAYSLVRGVSYPYFGAHYKDIIIYRAHVRKSDESCEGYTTIHFYDGDLVCETIKKIQ